jgi:hypothetical protein
MISKPFADRSELRNDLLLVAALVALAAVARLLPHLPNFTPVVAAAFFAGTALRLRGLALVVPLAAMLLSDAVIGFDNPGVTAVGYLSLMLPALAGILSRRLPSKALYAPALLSCSLLFFAASNLAVWAFSGMYSLDAAGLIKCYVAALPFLQYSVAGDLFWGAALFGGAWMIQALARSRHAPRTLPVRSAGRR